MNTKKLKELGEYACAKHCIDNYCISDKPIVFFEVGVFDGKTSNGFYSMVCANDRSDNKYFAFEPDSRNYDKIVSNDNFPIKKSGVELIKKALNSKTGIFKLFCSSGKQEGGENEYDCCSSLLEPDEVNELFPFIKFEETEEVNCITIDDFCSEKNIDYIDFIFADIQGAELEMLKGAENMINKIKFLFLEKSDNQKLYSNQPLTEDLIKYLSDRGFEVAKKFDSDILFYNKNLTL